MPLCLPRACSTSLAIRIALHVLRRKNNGLFVYSSEAGVLDFSPSHVLRTSLITVDELSNSAARISGAAGSVEPLARVIFKNRRTGETSQVQADSEGSFAVEVNAFPGDEFTVTLVDGVGNVSGEVIVSTVPQYEITATILADVHFTSLLHPLFILITKVGVSISRGN